MPTNPHPCVIVDDNEITALAHARQCSGLNVVGVFESATEALLFLQNRSVDVLLLDVDTPNRIGERPTFTGRHAPKMGKLC